MKQDKKSWGIHKKSKQLGMPVGTASNRLRKELLFFLAKKLNLNFCFHCNEEIKTCKEFSIEHKTPYLDSENPIKLFFDLENIAFSHFICNSKNRRIPIQNTRLAGNGYKGVSSPNKVHRKFRAVLNNSQTRIHIGCFNTKEEAAAAFDKKSKELFGDGAITNEGLRFAKSII